MSKGIIELGWEAYRKVQQQLDYLKSSGQCRPSQGCHSVNYDEFFEDALALSDRSPCTQSVARLPYAVIQDATLDGYDTSDYQSRIEIILNGHDAMKREA